MTGKRDRFLVVGLGTFGSHVARTLYELGKEVIALDRDSDVVESAVEFCTQAIVADATDRDTIESLGLTDVDAAVVSLGERMDVITLAALHLIEMGLPLIAVKSLSEEHGRILKALGIHEVVYPEKERAIHLANRLARTDLIDFLPVLPGYSIIEVKAPVEFVGKSLRELALRNTLRVQLVAIQSKSGERQVMNIIPRADDVIREGDLLILIGENGDLDRIREIAG